MKKKIVILGAGESGTGSAVLAVKNGFDVFVSDYGEIKEKYREILDNYNIRWEQGKHTEGEIITADEVIKSLVIEQLNGFFRESTVVGDMINQSPGNIIPDQIT